MVVTRHIMENRIDMMDACLGNVEATMEQIHQLLLEQNDHEGDKGDRLVVEIHVTTKAKGVTVAQCLMDRVSETGEKVGNKGVCTELEFQLPNVEFKQNCFLMELGGTRMVLGMDWRGWPA
ncbi:hypothetical protein L195_g000592 [Trifolium pratense]|uniref:Uncharacterized protein n=1 Tax=Trifolium pratense TaxID=57577 RepID=A0A2K3NMC1_TRIPR|nr:hypothetical protein L195_g000592 [Trifolium pratense]